MLQHEHPAPLVRRDALASLLVLLVAPHQATASSREIGWSDLVPAGWDPMAGLQDMNRDLDQLQDTDPRAEKLMRELRSAWDNAPIVPSLDGKQVRLPGYVVPLEGSKQGLRELLLVPYFGACIHSPPPPSNQVVLCRLEKPATGLRSMEAVWVAGRLAVSKTSSEMGVAGYSLAASHIQRQ